MPEPLKSKTMTLSDLQLVTLDLISKVRKQLNRQAHEDGMSDREFQDEVLDSLESEIYADRSVLRSKRREAKLAKGGE